MAERGRRGRMPPSGWGAAGAAAAAGAGAGAAAVARRDPRGQAAFFLGQASKGLSGLLDHASQQLSGLVGAVPPPAEEPGAARCLAEGLPPPRHWPQRPVLVTSGRGPGERGGGSRKVVLVNYPTPVDSPAFEGEALLRVRGAPEAPVPGGAQLFRECKEHFAGRRRQLWTTVRGKFKERVPVADVVVGHEFERAVRLPRHAGIVIALLRKIMPSMRIQVEGERPHLLCPLVAEAKAIRVRRTPSELDGPAHWSADEDEDNALFGGWFAKGSRSAAQRRRHFVRPENMEGHYFEPGLEYEFDFYQHQVDMKDYGLSLPGINLDLARVLDGQPAQAMAKLASRNEPLWEFSFWCERLVGAD